MKICPRAIGRYTGPRLTAGNGDRAVAMLGDAASLILRAPSQRNVRRILRARDQLPFAKSDPRSRELEEKRAVLVA